MSGVVLTQATTNASITASDSAQALTGQRSGIVVVAGAVTHFSVSAPASVDPGSPFAAQISATDNANNVATSYTGSLSLASSDGSASLPSSITLASVDAGSVRVGNLALVTAGPQTLTFTDAHGITGSANTTVAALGPVALDVSGATSGVAGHIDSITVTAVDAYGNPADGNVGTITFSSSDAQAVLPGPYALGAATTHQFSGVQFLSVGVQTLRVRATPPANAVLAGQQNNIIITKAATTRYLFFGLQDAVAGQLQNVTISATDAYGNLDANFVGTVALTSSDANVIMPASVNLVAGQGHIAATLKTAGMQTLSASGSSLSGTSPSVAIIAAAASRLTVTGVAGGTAGQAATATISAYDAYNNLATGYLGIVALTSSDPLAALPANLRFAAADAGTKSAPVVFFTPGTQALTATDTLTPSITGQQIGIVITAGQRFALTGPASVGVGQSFSVTVQALDNSNNVDPSFSGTVHLASTDPRATLPSDVTFAAGDAGQKTIAGFVLGTADAQTAIMATTLPAGRAGALYPIAVSVGSATGFTLSAPNSVTAGSNFNVTITATDSYGNAVPSYTGTAVVTSDDVNASIPGAIPFVPGDAGVKTATVTLRTATSTAILVATDNNHPSFTGQQGNIIVVPLATVSSITLTGLTGGAAGHTNSIAVTARDVYGNPVPQYRGTVNFSSSDALASLPGAYSFIGADQGAHMFSGVTLATVGNQSVTVTDAMRSASQTVNITSAAATFFFLNTNSTVVAGQAQNVTLVATDAAGNTDINYAGTVTLTSSDPMAVLPANYTFGALDAGHRVLVVTLQSAGIQSISANAAGGVTGTQSGIVVNPGATSRLSLSGLTQASTGSPSSITIGALDAAGNTTPAYLGTIHITSSDAYATLPTNYTYTSGAGGQHSAGVTFATAGNQSLTATDTTTPGINGTLANIAVAAPGARLRIAVAASTTAGAALPLTVQVLDNFNNIATAYTGTVLLNLSDAQATYAAQVAFTLADQGNKWVPGAFGTVGAQTVAAVDTQGALVGVIAAVTVAPAATDHYDVSAPVTVVAGGNIALSLVARDAYGNQTPSYAATARITSSDGSAVVPANVSFVGGTATPGPARATVANLGTTFTATDVTQPAIHGTSAGITVTPLTTVQLLVLGATSGVSGHLQNVTVSARDIYNNLVLGYRGVVALSSTDIAAPLPASYAFNSADAGSHLFAGLVLTTAGNQSISANDTTTTSIVGQQTNIVISAGAATQLYLVGPATATAGMAQSFAIGATDAYGNLDANFRGTVTLNSTDTQASLPPAYAFIAGDAGNHNAVATLVTAGSQSATVASAGLTSATASIAVFAAPLSHLAVSGLMTAPAGTVQSAIVRAVDNYNNSVSSYRGTVAITSTDSRASLQGNYTYLSGDTGSKSLTTTLFTPGLQQLRAIDIQNPNLAGAQNAIVTVAPTQLTVVSDTNVTAGVAFNVTLSATDAYGNIDVNYTGTVHLTSTDSHANLPADITFVSGNQGVVTLTHQTILKTASASQTLTATDGGLVGTQSGIAVKPGPAATLAVMPPTTATAGTPMTLSVAAYDAYGNLATSYTGHIVFSASDPNATLPPASTFSLANLGSKTFVSGVRLVHQGVQIITVTDTNNLLTGSGATTVQSATASTLVLMAPATSVAGASLTVSVTAYDAYGNTATAMNDTITIAGSDSLGTYPGAVTFVLADAGSKTITNLTTLRTATVTSLSATDTTAPGVTPATAYVVVAAAPIASLVVSAPAAVTAATVFSSTIAGVDAYLNIVNTYTAALQLTSTDPAGLPSSGTPLTVNFTSGSAAQRTISNLRLMTAGSQLLSVADPNNNAIFGSTPVQVNPGSPNALALTTSPNVNAGQTTAVTLTALDAGNNVAPSFVGTVGFSSTDPNATLPPSTTFALSDLGEKTLGAALTWRKAGNQILTATSSGLSAGVTTVAVNASSVSGLQLFGLGNLVAGVSNQATVRAIDSFGNIVPTYTGTVTWTSSDPAASLPGALAFTSADVGSKVATLRLYTAGAQSVTAMDLANSFAATQSNVIVGVQRSRFAVTSPNTITAGASLTLGVAATDAYNNLDANYTGALHFTSSDPNASFPAGISIAGTDHGQRSISNIILTTAHSNATITVLDNTNSIIGTTGPIVVTPGNANHLNVATATSTPAGTPLTATVTAYDAYNNVATGYTGAVTVTTNDANAVLPVSTSFVSNGNGVLSIASIYLLSATNNASVTVTDNNTSSVTGAQTGIQVTPLVADHFVLTGLASGAAGHTNNLTVVVRDIYNNIATSYRGTVTFTSSDAAAYLPNNYAYTGADQGSHLFSGVSLATVGTQSVTAHDTSQTGIIGSQSGIVVTGNSASHLALTGSTTAIAGQGQNILIAAVDAYGNIDVNFAGTVSFTTTDPNAIVSAAYTFASSDAGTHLLPVTYTTAAVQTLSAAGPVAVGTTQINTTVTPGNANAYALGGIPNAPAGQSTSVTVRVIDAYNNTVPLYRGQAAFTSSDPNAILPNPYLFVAADNGIKAVGLTLTTAGTQWVRATDTNTSSITGQQTGIVVGVAQSHLQVACNTNETAGVAFPITVTAVDAYGNLNTGYTGRVHFTSGDVNATLPGDTNVLNANNGTITVAGAILRVATANQSITVTDTNVSSYTGAQSGIVVKPANANAIVLSGPVSITAGVNTTATVTAYDAFNNVATGYFGTVAFSSTDPNALLPSTTAYTGPYAGTHAFVNALVLVHAGNQNVVATDANNNLFSRLGIAVAAAAPASLVLSTPATSTAGNVVLAQVQAQDAYGNVAASYRGTVAFSSGDSNASYPNNYAFLSSDNGNKTFASGLILRTSGSQVISVSDANNISLGAGASITAVNSAPLSSFRLTAPAIVTSESSFVATFSGLDIYGNVANTYGGTTHLTSSDPNGTPSTTHSIDFTFANGSAVQRSVSGVLLNSGGNQTLYVRDANNPNTINGQANVTVMPLPATTLALAGFPTPLTAGQQGNLTVRAYDNYGNVATGYAGTLVFTSSDPNALLSPNYTFVPADLGVHTFMGLSLRTAGSNQSIAATDANGVTGTQSSIIINPASPNSLILTGPSTASAGTAFTVVATALDVYNNTASNYTGTVTFSSSNANATKPSAYVFTIGSGNDNGTHTFTNGLTIYLSGSQNVTIVDANARTSVLAVSVSAANANSLVWTAPSTTIAGTPLATAITAYDRYNNIATGYRGLVTVTSNDTHAILPSAYTFASGDNGAHAFNGNIALLTSGTHTLLATDANAGASVVSAQANVLVSPNATTQFLVTLPATVQPALTYSATIASRDGYSNATPAYTGNVNLLSSDTIGTPSTSSAVPVVFSAGNNGSLTIANLRLRTVGTQSLSARDASTSSITGTASTSVQAQNFTTAFNFNNTTQANYTYDANKLAIGLNTVYLTPIYTTTGDTNAANFAASTSTSLAWDSNGFVRLSTAALSAPYMFYTSLEPFDPNVSWVNTVDTAIGNSNVVGLCCGLTGPQSNPNTTIYKSGATSLFYSGSALSGGNAYAYTKVWNLQNQNITLDANSYISYSVYPQATTGATGNGSVNANNSTYIALNVVFADGTDTRSSAVVNSNGVLLNPNSQGSAGGMGLNQWNSVKSNLSSLSGKKVSRIDLGWACGNCSGGYAGYIDDVFVGGTINVPRTNTSTLDASWAPAWSNIVGYWNMDGEGAIANNANITGVVGPNLVAHNANGQGMTFASGALSQAIYLDGVDDYLRVSATNFPSTTAMSFSGWVKPVYNPLYTNTRVYSLSVDTYCTYCVEFFFSSGTTMVRRTANGSTYDTTPNASFPYGDWYHLATTLDANGLASVYVNGVLYGALSQNVALSSMVGAYSTLGVSLYFFDNYTRGFYDEIAFWNVALTQGQVEAIYQRQSAAFSGSLTSRVLPSPFQGAATTGLSWTSTLPYGKALPSGTNSETASGYSGLTGSALNANLITLWHFDEPGLQTVIGGDFYDDSGHGNIGVAWKNQSTWPVANIVGNFNRSVHFAGAYGTDLGVIGQSSLTAPNTLTVSAWFRTTAQGELVGFGNSGAAGFSGTFDRFLFVDTAGRINFGLYTSSYKILTSSQSYNDGRWHHAVGTLSTAGSVLYVDGQAMASDATVTSASSYVGFWHVGCDTISGSSVSESYYCFHGEIDEVGIWNRALSTLEVLQLYRRGADRVKYQIKICAASDCSDATTWQGPDATATTYFSEINNVAGLSGFPGAPALQFSTVAPTLVVDANKAYVQYKMILESDDINQLCVYNGSQAPCSPEINASQFFRINYSTSAPSVANLSGVPYYQLQTLAGTLGAAGCPAGVTYVLSPDGSSKYYYNGSTWTSSNGSTAQSNTAAQITSSVMGAFSTQFPFGQTYFLAYLASDGIHPCTLASVTWTGNQ